MRRHDLLDLVSDAAERVRPICEGKRVRLKLSGQGISACVDPELMALALGNVLRNAVEFAPKESCVTVRVSTSARQPCAVVEVLDRGPGFTAEEAEHAFEAGYSHKEQRLGIEGHGLGLSLVLAIVETHRGHVSAANRPGGGAIISIELPHQENHSELHPDR